MHANLLTVEAAVEDLQSAVRKAQGVWRQHRDDHPSRDKRGASARTLTHASFPHTGTPYPQHAAVRGSQALRRHRLIIPQASIMAPSLTKLVLRQHAPICVVSSCTQEARCEAGRQ